MTTCTRVSRTIKFIIDVEANYTLPFLGVLVTKRGPNLTTEVYKKPTHTGRYLHFKVNCPYHVFQSTERRSYVKIIMISTTKFKIYDMIWCSVNIQKNHWLCNKANGKKSSFFKHNTSILGNFRKIQVHRELFQSQNHLQDETYTPCDTVENRTGWRCPADEEECV
jgi:hypothetical protein